MNDFQGHTHKSTHTLSFLTLEMITRLMFSRVHNVTYYVLMISQKTASCGFQRISEAMNLSLDNIHSLVMLKIVANSYLTAADLSLSPLCFS